jgi:hypothetical protein
MKRLFLAAAALATLTGATVAATAATAPRDASGVLPLAEIEASIDAQIDERLRTLLPELRASR